MNKIPAVCRSPACALLQRNTAGEFIRLGGISLVLCHSLVDGFCVTGFASANRVTGRVLAALGGASGTRSTGNLTLR